MRTLLVALTMLIAAVPLSAQSIRYLYGTKEEACAVTESYNYRLTDGYTKYGQIGWEKEVGWRPIQYLEQYESEHRTYSINSFLYCQVEWNGKILDDCEIVAIDSRGLVVGNQCPEPKPIKATVDNVAIIAIFGEIPGEEIKFKVVVGTGTAEDPLVEYWAEETHSFVPNGTTGLLDKDGDGRLDTWDPVVLHLRPSEVATISDLGYATYSPTRNVILTREVEAFTVTVNTEQNMVELHPVSEGTVVAAGTGYVLRAEEGNYSFPVTATVADEIGENELLVSDGTLVVSETDRIYALGLHSDGCVGFMRVKEGVTIPEGKAYLRLPSSYSAKFLPIGVHTAISETEIDNTNVEGEYYTLQGVKTKKPTRGLYIINGKKVIVKL